MYLNHKEKGSKYYDKKYAVSEEYSKSWVDSWYAPLWELVINMIPEGKKILEIGCGTGQFSCMLKFYGHTNYEGFDFSKVAIQKAREMNPAFHFEIANAYTYFYENFDVAIATEVFEHLEDYKILKKIRGKNVIFTVPEANDPAHLRVFKDFRELCNHYEPKIEIETIIKLNHRYIVKGIVK
jgi:2-polyprenyl-3-methyl-5-hydroxy-6-metoxy-1,4-benzoquinol methylase